MKQMLTVTIVLFLACSFAFGQGWLTEAFPDASGHPGNSGHGMAVDGAGKIWYSSYWVADSMLVPEHGDTTATGADTTILAAYSSCRAIYVFNEDGSQASFSPIKSVTNDAVTDTFWNSTRGMRETADGNIAYISYNDIFIIDHLTGEGIAVIYDAIDGTSLISPGFDEAGNMIMSTVLPGFGFVAWDSEYDLIDEVLGSDYRPGYSRCMELSADGNDIYYCNFTGPYVIRYHSNDGVDGDFTTTVDTVFVGKGVESIAWQPVTGYLWGGDNVTKRHYALDVTTDLIVDSMSVGYGMLDAISLPRGIAFSADGTKAYLTYYDSSDNPAIFRMTKFGAGVWETDLVIAIGFTLGKNYPNPFNPNTIIPFDIYQTNAVKLTVYDITGREVQTLVNETLSPNHYEMEFGGTELATGSYFYRLTVGGQTVTNMMTLLK